MIRYFRYTLLLLCSSLALTATAQRVATRERVDSVLRIIAQLDKDTADYQLKKETRTELRNTLRDSLKRVILSEDSTLIEAIKAEQHLNDSLLKKLDEAVYKRRQQDTALLRLANDVLKVAYNKRNVEYGHYAFESIGNPILKKNFEGIATLLYSYEAYWNELYDILREIEKEGSSEDFKIRYRDNTAGSTKALRAKLNKHAYYRRANKEYKIFYLDTLLGKASEQIGKYPSRPDPTYEFKFEDLLP